MKKNNVLQYRKDMACPITCTFQFTVAIPLEAEIILTYAKK